MPSFQYRSSSVEYSIEGEGKPVVFIHGFGEDSSVWNAQIEWLRLHCKTIRLDLPGSGRSSVLKEAETIDDYADMLHAFIDHLKLDKFILLGHSMGGYITLAYAEKYPKTLRAWGLVHSTAFADSSEKKETRRKAIEFIRNNGAFSFLKTSTPNLFSERTKRENPQIINELIDRNKNFTQEALIQYYEAMILRPDRTPVLSSSETPVLFILGTEDTAAPMADVLKQVHLPETSYIHIIQDVGHMSMLESADILNKHLQKFINDV